MLFVRDLKMSFSLTMSTFSGSGLTFLDSPLGSGLLVARLAAIMELIESKDHRSAFVPGYEQRKQKDFLLTGEILKVQGQS